jgi:hypothetical protein
MLIKEVKETILDDLLNCSTAPHGYRLAQILQMVTTKYFPISISGKKSILLQGE